MNWLGELIQKEVSLGDTVLDLGCGIIQATNGLVCKNYTGCDIWTPYLNKIKNEINTIRLEMNELDRFPDQSYDVVICLDVVEHLDKELALKVLEEVKRICRKKAIIYTPSEFDSNESAVENSWGLGHNEYQKHKCLMSLSELNRFTLTKTNKDKNMGWFAVWKR